MRSAPSLHGLIGHSELTPQTRCVLEIVIDGLSEADVAAAMRRRHARRRRARRGRWAAAHLGGQLWRQARALPLPPAPAARCRADMSGWTLRAKQAPALRVDLRGVTPAALAARSSAEVERWPVGHGKALVPLGEFFSAQARGDDALVFEADLRRFDRVGWQMAGGRLQVEGDVGDYAGGGMRGGELVVRGSALALTACEMAGGLLTIGGNVGDFAASTLPGSMDGMRGGNADRARQRRCALRRSHAPRHRAGIRRRRRLSGLAHGGRHHCDPVATRGAHVGYGMRRGSVVFAGSAPGISIDLQCRRSPRPRSSGNCWRAIWPATAVRGLRCRSGASNDSSATWRPAARAS